MLVSLASASFFLAFVLSISINCLRRHLVVVTVHGLSMVPTYQAGDRVLVRRKLTPEVGQVVVVDRQRPGEAGEGMSCDSDQEGIEQSLKWLIKRVVAVPGDLLPDGVYLEAVEESTQGRVPAGKLVLFGDNQELSIDSRQLGYFHEEQIVGTVIRALRRD